jgi:hypothetical protein
MKNPVDNQFLLIGLPSTGKTSFLAAVWYMVGQSSTECALGLDKVEGEVKYLNEIRDAWSNYRPVPRNKADSEKLVSMWLRHRETGQLCCLRFPDLSGEAFRSQWAERQMSASYDKHLRDASGGVLFLHPEATIKPHSIDTVSAALEAIGPDDPGEERIVQEKQRDKQKSPTQVQLVDVLQLMVGRGHFHFPFRLAIVVSAWDRLSGTGRPPSHWIETELPLLTQFLDSNEEMFEVSHYGISAQGGRYALPHFWSDNFNDCQAFAKRLCEHNDPVSIWLWEKLDQSSRTTLESLQSGGQSTLLQKKALANDLNRLMADEPDIYDPNRYAGVKLRPRTENLLRSGVLQKPEEKLYLIRLLLEDAYPEELSKEREHAAEAAELQQKPPARRVVVVGDGVRMSHDVTEPIQWLMR